MNRRYAEAVAAQAAPGATVWVQDYQLQLVPGMVRELRSDVRIGHFTHIPFPATRSSPSCPGAGRSCGACSGPNCWDSSARATPRTSCAPAGGRPAWRHGARWSGSRMPGSTTRSPTTPPRSGRRQRVAPDDFVSGRDVRAAAFPISIDAAALEEIARRPDVQDRSQEIREALGKPDIVLLGIDRLDYTKGILHRLNAYGEVLDEGRLGPPEAVLVQVASPSRERVEQYRRLRDEVEVTVGRINGEHGEVGVPPVHYLHQSYPREEMAALYLAADVMLVTPLRDGMNLVAKEYVACRYDETGALVLSEFTGAADELGSAFIVNPHDIEGLKDAIVRAATVSPAEARRRMRSMRRRVREHDVAYWAETFLDALSKVPLRDSAAGDSRGLGGGLARAAGDSAVCLTRLGTPLSTGPRSLAGLGWRAPSGAGAADSCRGPRRRPLLGDRAAGPCSGDRAAGLPPRDHAADSAGEPGRNALFGRGLDPACAGPESTPITRSWLLGDVAAALGDRPHQIPLRGARPPRGAPFRGRPHSAGPGRSLTAAAAEGPTPRARSARAGRRPTGRRPALGPSGRSPFALLRPLRGWLTVVHEGAATVLMVIISPRSREDLHRLANRVVGHAVLGGHVPLRRQAAGPALSSPASIRAAMCSEQRQSP